MLISYQGQSESRTREVYKSNVKSTSFTSPTEGVTLGTPVPVLYVLESDVGLSDVSIEMEYSINSGEDFYTCSGDSSSSSHEGLIGLSADDDGTGHVFMWDAEEDVGKGYDGSVVLRLRSYDGANYDDWIESDSFFVNLLPSISISAPNGGVVGEPVDISYVISCLKTNVLFSVEVEYSEDGGESWSSCTADASDPDHTGVVYLGLGGQVFVWDSVADLGEDYSQVGIKIKIRANSGFGYGEWEESSPFQVDMLPICNITAPLSDSVYGSPIDIVYTITTYCESVTEFSVDMQYSVDDGEEWLDCCALDTDPDHSGVSGLSEGTSIFVWNSASDLTSAYANDSVLIRVRANDGTADGEWHQASAISINMLPAPPILIDPFNTYFDTWDGAEFTWYIPSDPGSDWIHFNFRLIYTNDDTVVIDHDTITTSVGDPSSEDEYRRFSHRIDSSPATKNGANGITYFVRGLDVTSITGTEVAWSDLTDHHKEIALPASLTNPKIIFLNRLDRQSYIDPTSIDQFGFTIYKRTYGGDADGKVDLLIYTGAAEDFETYWKTLTITGETVLTFGSGALATDDLGRTIPSSITNARVEVMDGSDQAVYVSASSETGCTINKCSYGVGGDASIVLLIREDPSETYQHREMAVTYYDSFTTFLPTHLDATEAGAGFPEYIPGTIATLTQRSDRHAYAIDVLPDSIRYGLHGFGLDDDGSVDVHVESETDDSIPYFSDMSNSGVPDTYEDGVARYKVNDADKPAEGNYTWVIRAGNYYPGEVR